jgi:hypothetical protein
LLTVAGQSCSLLDAVNSAPSAPLPTANPTEVTCLPATTSSQVGEILYNAQLREHQQPAIRITLVLLHSIQWIDFVKPDRFHWKNQAGETWEEVISVGGSSYARSSSQGWQPTPLLDPDAALLLQAFTNPPKKLSEATIAAQLTAAGVSDVKFEGRSAGLTQDFSGTCVYELFVKSGDRIMYSEKTWIGANDGLRYKVEITDQTGQVIEARQFSYEFFNIDAPSP